LGAGSAGPFRGYKTQFYEGGVRSSLIAWGPGLLQKENHVDRDSVFAAIDLVPTLLDLRPMSSNAFIASGSMTYAGSDRVSDIGAVAFAAIGSGATVGALTDSVAHPTMNRKAKVQKINLNWVCITHASLSVL
jgi:hypothetical protein